MKKSDSIKKEGKKLHHCTHCEKPLERGHFKVKKSKACSMHCVHVLAKKHSLENSSDS